MSDGWQFAMVIACLVVSIRAVSLQRELDQINKSNTESSTKKNSNKNKSSRHKDGDWTVKMRKPKQEIVISGCDTEGDVVRRILAMGLKPENVRDIIQL
jgi:hypothetical protein